MDRAEEVECIYEQNRLFMTEVCSAVRGRRGRREKEVRRRRRKRIRRRREKK